MTMSICDEDEFDGRVDNEGDQFLRSKRNFTFRRSEETNYCTLDSVAHSELPLKSDRKAVLVSFPFHS